MIGPRRPALAWILLTLMAFPDDLVVTSICDGEHMAGSAHYRGEAVDIRSNDLNTLTDKRLRAKKLKATLGLDFTVLLEPYDIPGSTAAEHIHVQLTKASTFDEATLMNLVSVFWLTRPMVQPPPARS